MKERTQQCDNCSLAPWRHGFHRSFKNCAYAIVTGVPQIMRFIRINCDDGKVTSNRLIDTVCLSDREQAHLPLWIGHLNVSGLEPLDEGLV